MKRTKTSWTAMIARCYHKSNNKYPRYGGRGIKVCKKWRHSFDSFLSDMGIRPEGFTIDRIDNDGDYTPDNCRWADAKTQARNRSDNRMLTFRGKTRTLPEWAELIGLSRETLKRRFEHGWTMERALTTPRDTKYHPIREPEAQQPEGGEEQ